MFLDQVITKNLKRNIFCLSNCNTFQSKPTGFPVLLLIRNWFFCQIFWGEGHFCLLHEKESRLILCKVTEFIEMNLNWLKENSIHTLKNKLHFAMQSAWFQSRYSNFLIWLKSKQTHSTKNGSCLKIAEKKRQDNFPYCL